MLQYLIQWGHAYIMHFGMWVTFGVAVSIYKNGLPQPKELYKLFESALILSAILSIFSSQSHTHYLQKLVPESKILHGQTEDQ